MKFRKKISFSIFVVKILLVPHFRSFPQTLSSNSYVSDTKVPYSFSCDISPFSTQLQQHNINGEIGNIIQEPVYETFNLLDTEYPLVSKPQSELISNKNKRSLYCKSRSKYLPTHDSPKGIKNTKNELFALLPEFSSAPIYRDIANFPEVEYPLTANEIWKPNFWNSPQTDFPYNNENINYYSSSPVFNEYPIELIPTTSPKKNLGSKTKPRPSMITKSYSGSTKNLNTIKNKENTDYDLINNNQIKNTNFSLDSPKEDGIHIKVTPLSLATCPIEMKSTSDFSNDVCQKYLEVPYDSTKFLTNDVVSNLTVQSERLTNPCADTFKNETKAVLKTATDNVIVNNLNSKKVKETQTTPHTSDILDTSVKSSSLNIYDEFESPDLMKNRRSQDLNEFPKYYSQRLPVSNDNHESKLSLTDLLIDSYAEKFYKEMTSILKSHADDFLLNTFESSKNRILEKNMNRNDHKDYTNEEHLTQHHKYLNKDFSKVSYEPLLSITEDVMNTHADKLHNEMTIRLDDISDKILLNKFEIDNNKPSSETKIYTKNNNNNNRNNNNKASSRIPTYKSDIPDKKKITSTTQSPIVQDISSNPHNKVLQNKQKQKYNKETENRLNNTTLIPLDVSPSTASTQHNRADEGITKNSNKDGETFLPASATEGNIISQSESIEKEIEIEEDFTTDSYPENNGDWSSYALSTVAPRTSTVDLVWRESSVIEQEKSLSYPDELEQYFLMT